MAHRLASRQVIRSVAAAVVVGVALLGGAPAQASLPGANGKIAFSTNRVVDTHDVYRIDAMNPDGTGSTNLITRVHPQSEPAWSPDGTKIAFSGFDDSGTNVDIYTMNADGSGVARLTSNSAGEGTPAWSPDGTKIAYARGSPNAIWVMNADGSGQTSLAANAAMPAWSPDGTKIAFFTARDNCQPGPEGEIICDPELYVMKAEGTSQTRLTYDGAQPNASPNWSPDGTRILFSGWGIWVINSNGSGEHLIASSGTNPYWESGGKAVWSPDGRRIAFQALPVCCQGSGLDIFVMNADGSGQANLTNNGASPAPSNGNPSWQPLPTATYAHPQSASSFQASLVPTFRPCGTGANPTNGQHSTPLGTQSCLPPTPGSNVARIGSTSVGTASFTGPRRHGRDQRRSSKRHALRVAQRREDDWWSRLRAERIWPGPQRDHPPALDRQSEQLRRRFWDGDRVRLPGAARLRADLGPIGRLDLLGID